jgi:hypothetical protein
MNFPDNWLTSCTSIEQVNLPSSHIGKMYYINTGIVTFLTHILCVSSWIMGDGQIGKIYIDFLWTFQIICSRVALLLSSSTYLSVILKKCCINTGIVTFLTHILCFSLESWVTDGWKIYIVFLWTFQIIGSQVALLLSRSTYLPVILEKYILSTPG